MIFHETSFPYPHLFSTTATTPNNSKTKSSALHLSVPQSLPASSSVSVPSPSAVPPTVSAELPPNSTPANESSSVPEESSNNYTPVAMSSPISAESPLNSTPVHLSSLVSVEVPQIPTLVASNPSVIHSNRPEPRPSSPYNTHLMITRSKTGSLKPKLFVAHVEPATVK